MFNREEKLFFLSITLERHSNNYEFYDKNTESKAVIYAIALLHSSSTRAPLDSMLKRNGYDIDDNHE